MISEQECHDRYMDPDKHGSVDYYLYTYHETLAKVAIRKRQLDVIRLWIAYSVNIDLFIMASDDLRDNIKTSLAEKRDEDKEEEDCEVFARLIVRINGISPATRRITKNGYAALGLPSTAKTWLSPSNSPSTSMVEREGGAVNATPTAPTATSTAAASNDTAMGDLTSQFERLGGSWNIEKAKEWNQANAKALSIMLDGLSSDDAVIIDEYETGAAAVWAQLQKRYADQRILPSPEMENAYPDPALFILLTTALQQR
ncbi:hypothetical protein E4U40_001123 [Claviceps sp. LM458 group G5]|nr:hypothetical protein E4U40_001123 [Claviceps sp. LM458 group G5]